MICSLCQQGWGTASGGAFHVRAHNMGVQGAAQLCQDRYEDQDDPCLSFAGMSLTLKVKRSP